MTVALWAEIRRLKEIEKLSRRAIARRLRCCQKTVSKALSRDWQPPPHHASAPEFLLPFRPKIDALIQQYPRLSAVRVLEEISRGEQGYRGSVYPLRRYLRRIRPPSGRVYQEVLYEPGEALQVDWGTCAEVSIGATVRRVHAFIAVLCYSRLCFLKFSLSQNAPSFYRALVEAFAFFGGLPRKLIFDNLKPAVLDGHGRHARFHPRFLALCGHYCLQPLACQRRDPESKGVVEASIRYVKHNALQGRHDLLQTWEGYLQLAPYWRDQVANVRLHHTTRERPIERFQREKTALRALPEFPFDTDEDFPTVVSPHAKVRFDANRYSVPPQYRSKTVAVRANDQHVWVLCDGKEIARHRRCHEKHQLLSLPEHHLAALQLRHRARASQIERDFDALGPLAQAFHLKLLSVPVKKSIQLRKLLALVRLYGRSDVLAALRLALEAQTYDAPSVENILHQLRRRRQLPSPVSPQPQRKELIEDIDLPTPDPATYDSLFGIASTGDPHNGPF
jgi:transposase